MSAKTEIGVLEEQIKILESAVFENPANSTAYFHLGELKFILGLYLDALICFEQTASKDVNFLKSYIETAKIYIIKKMNKDAHGILKKISSEAPSNLDGFILYNKLKKQSEERLEPIEVFENFDTTDEEVTNFQVNYQLKLGQYEKLIKEYEALCAEGGVNLRHEFLRDLLNESYLFCGEILNDYEILKINIRKISKDAAVKKEKIIRALPQNEPLLGVLKEFLKLRSIMSVCVFTQDGEVLACASLKPLYETLDYAQLVDDLSAVEQLTKDRQLRMNFICLEYSDGLVFINKLDQKHYFIACGEGVVNFGSLKYAFDKNKDALCKQLSL